MEELIKIIKVYVPDIENNKEQSLIEEGLIDSIELLEIIEEISEKFKIDIGGADLDPDNFQSVQEIWEFIKRKSNR